MMNEISVLLLAAAGGGLLGLFYFGGLRWTLRKCLDSRSAALWLSGSFLLRTAACLYGFYWIGAADLGRILACLAGFIVARSVLTRLPGAARAADDSAAQAARHAP